MSARRRLAPAQRRELLLDAAEDAFARSGPSAARVEDVAETAGVAVGLLYRHFPSKDAILDAVMQRRTERLDERMQTHLAQLARADVPAASLVSEGLRLWLELVTTEVAEGRWVPLDEPEPCARFRAKTRAVVVARITEAVPDLDAGIAAVIAAALEGVAETTARAWTAQHQPTDVSVLLTIVTNFCLGGLERLGRLLDIDIDLG
ncbi:TetR/AcrR family transcriptional regulator [Mycolicibacterium moriokaense]|uniref:TetR family transcriptional regulator n=1 Tax=Mycolicibacterium moriokaense TaxID=39691 RepID=A0A318HB09_9MYCO|nr:TetR/AcrR family transcriptional regulator [Mycolicibacterium moriokaense]PXW95921.1 TetR family transcriptional regulator [Mycolicibacterium moriokaense]